MNTKNSDKPTVKAMVNPTILFTPQALLKMNLITELATTEAGWFGFVTQLDLTTYLVDDVWLGQQQAHGAECEIDKNAILDMATQLMQEPDGEQKLNRLRLWGHSHVNMGVTPSATDNDTFKGYYNDVEDFFVMLIMNKSGSIRCDLALPPQNIIVCNCNWDIFCEGYDAIKAEIKQQVKERVQPKQTTLWDDDLYGVPETYRQGWRQRWQDHVPAQTDAKKKTPWSSYSHEEVARWEKHCGQTYTAPLMLLRDYIKIAPPLTNISIDRLIEIDKAVTKVMDSLNLSNNDLRQADTNRPAIAKEFKLFDKKEVVQHVN